VSFLPHSNHTYRQAPYEEIDEETYNQLKEQQPDVDFSQLVNYEQDDSTINTKELACTAGHCEL
jgi:ribonucleoside-diphosphate reductase alpha chain